MKKKTEKEEQLPEGIPKDLNDDLAEFIRKKNIQNKVLKELIEKIKNTK